MRDKITPALSGGDHSPAILVSLAQRPSTNLASDSARHRLAFAGEFMRDRRHRSPHRTAPHAPWPLQSAMPSRARPRWHTRALVQPTRASTGRLATAISVAKRRLEV